MSKLKTEIIITVMLVLVIASLAGYNVFAVQAQKAEALRQVEEQARQEEDEKKRQEEMLAEKESLKIAEMIKYYDKYLSLKYGLIKKSGELYKETHEKMINIEQLKGLILDRINAAEKYRKEITGIDTPEQLKNFLIYEIEFIESDILTMNKLLDYYNSGNYSTYDKSELVKLYTMTYSLMQKADTELISMYEQHEIDYLLK